MRHRISSNIRWIRFLFTAIGLVILFDIMSSIIEDNFDNEKIIIEFVFIIACFGLSYLFNKAKIVEFDNNFMYIRSKTFEEKIPLKNVYKIKMTMTKINKQNMWKIGYYEKDQVEKSIRILPRFFSKDFEEFKNIVKIKNRNVELQNWSYSLDFDQ